MADKVNYKALIKFSETTRTVILDVNELFNISTDEIYSTDIIISNNDSFTPEVIQFLETNGFRINGHHIVANGEILKYKNEDIPESYISQHPNETHLNTPVNYSIYTYNKNIDAIYTLSFDKFDITEDFTELNFNFIIRVYSQDNSGITNYPVSVNITYIASESIKLYDYQANIIGDDTGSFMVLRTNPKLTGNIKLVVTEDYKLYLDTFKVSSASILNERKYRHQSVAANGNYAHDVKTIFSDLPKGVLYNVHSDAYLPHKNYYDINIQVENTYEYGAENNYDSLYTENMKILAPLYISKKLPDYFCIFKTDNIINTETYNNVKIDDLSKLQEALKNPQIVKIFDLRNSTSIGQYLKTYTDIVNAEIQGACHLQFLEQNFKKVTDENYRQGRNTWYGIDINKGIITKKVETSYFGSKILENEQQRQEKYNMYILNGFERNNLLYPNIINLEFMFNDEDAENMSMHNYFGLYLTENQFLKFNSITSSTDNNSTITYFDANNNELSINDINLDILENEDYADRIFFMSTISDVSYINNMLDINTFIKKYVNNIPGKNICNIKAEPKDFEDINNFISMKFTKPIQYGEHFKFIFMHNYTNTETLVFDIIASNDIRLRYTKDNINPYISTNTPDDVTKDISVFTQIFRTSFYTQDLSDPNKVTSLDVQLQRIQACIRKFVGSNIFVGDLNNNSISFCITYGEDDITYNDVYFQHILAEDETTDYIKYYNFNNIYNTDVLKYNNDLYPDNLVGFANNGLELTGDRRHTIIKFINTNKLKDNFVYQVNYDLYKDLKNIISPIVNTIKGYYPLLKYDIIQNSIKYRNHDDVYVFDENDNIPSFLDDLETNTLQEFCIISPFDVSAHIVLSAFKARLINSYINICAPKTASLSLMGINNVVDIDTWINNEETMSYKKVEGLSIKAGEKLYIGKDIRLYTTYKLLSGNIRNIPSGNNVTFTIFGNNIIYTYNDNVYTVNLPNNYLLADEDSVISLYDTSYFDDYNYTTCIKQQDVNNYYKFINDKNNSDLIIPIVPLVNCNWKSNGIYFDHNSILNTDYQNYNYLSDVCGHFTENIYFPGNDNNGQYINQEINDYIAIDNKRMSIRDFILNGNYKYPLKKFLTQNFKLETAKGYYNKYIQTLEFIFYGIKFIITFNNNEYTRNIKLDEYNNYQIFIFNNFDGSNKNEIFISKQEQFILIINHIYNVNTISTNDNIIAIDKNFYPVNYNWYNAPYNYDISNCAKLDNTYIFKKNNTNIVSDAIYIIENDLDVYDTEFNMVYNEHPYYCYIKVNDTFKSYEKNDKVEHTFLKSELETSLPTIMGLMGANEKYKNYFNVSPLNDIYNEYEWKVIITEHHGVDVHGNDYVEYEREEGIDLVSPEPVNNIYSFFNNYDINFRQKNTYVLQKQMNEYKQYSYKDKLLKYKESFENKDMDMYIIDNRGYSKISITDTYQPIKLSLNISYTKYNHGIFSPSFKPIFEFSTNDDISSKIGMDCLLANTHISNINSIKNYTCNKVVKTGNFVTNNYFILPTKEMFSSCWDNNIYRLYTNDTNFDGISGYITGIEDKSLFGSKCIIIHDNEIAIQKYDFVKDNIKESIGISNYNENTEAQNTYNININLTKIFYNTIINNENFYNNWTLSIGDMSKSQTAMNNYISNTLLKFFNVNNNYTLHMYRKYDINKLDSDTAFIYDMPEDFSEYEEYMNFTTDYEISDNDLFINITIPEYSNYYYYLIIKINRY